VGDTRRNEVFARFIVKHYPKVRSVLVVADGNGELSTKLGVKGLKVRMIEAKPRHLKKHRNVQVQRGWFSEVTKVTEDLIVGMHPDEATIEIILCAKKNSKPFAVVPCCAKVMPGREKYKKGTHVGSRKAWVNKLRDIADASQCQESVLPIQGANAVLWST
jgi:hypothetical protein